MIVWGGTDRTAYVNTGGRYNPATDTWTPTGLVNVPLGKHGHTAVWTGTEMIVWGGVDQFFQNSNTGGRYNPSTDSWTTTNLGGVPSARSGHTAVWTGNEMIVWGGQVSGGANLNSGSRYNPVTDAWTSTTTANAPARRVEHNAVWTGTQMIVWGGSDYSGVGTELNSGGRYCAQLSTPLVQSAVSRKLHANPVTLDINLPLSGTPGIECRSGGATSDYQLVIDFNTAVIVAGNPQAQVTSGNAQVGSNGISNGGNVIVSGSTVKVPLTTVANAQTISLRLNGVNNGTGNNDLTISFSVLVGDTDGDGFVNSGDALQTRNRSGQAANTINFRSDVNLDGVINSGDTVIVRARSGTALP